MEETMPPGELDDLFPSSEDESRNDRDLTHLLQKARKYGDNGHRGRRRGSNPGRRKNKYQQYLHAAGALLARKAGSDVGHAVGGKYGAAAGRLAGMYAANPARFGDNPQQLINAAVGRRRRRHGRRRRKGGRGRRGRGGRGRGRGHARGGRQGAAGRGGHRVHRGLGDGNAGHADDCDGDDDHPEEEEDEGNSSDSSGTSSDWE